MSGIDLAILLVVAGMSIFAVRKLRRNAKNGGCAGCSGSCNCSSGACSHSESLRKE